ncbi:hypothetical protein [Pedobacter sp.]|jgi:hypothetical protein|uniref:hypothetical protein n=1 Tax=Pedobacter sp. TaxID=1411316 RepID=UPI002C296DD6|nr:hypothetical protein [Pedobacter sp.]HWW41529.1 hypothetical protein [Pedobacter sp.]
MKSKAIFLLVIFLLNTVVGLGCALGMQDDHHDHQHADGHEHKTISISGLSFSEEDHCCKTLVNDLVTQSKLIPESGKVLVVLPVMWLPDYSYTAFIPITSIEPGESVYVDRRERPPNQDIRITIKSFQI